MGLLWCPNGMGPLACGPHWNGSFVVPHWCGSFVVPHLCGWGVGPNVKWSKASSVAGSLYRRGNIISSPGNVKLSSIVFLVQKYISAIMLLRTYTYHSINNTCEELKQLWIVLFFFLSQKYPAFVIF